MNAADEINYLLLEIYNLRERAERCRRKSQLLLHQIGESSADLHRTQERFHLVPAHRTDPAESLPAPALVTSKR
jgi:hypothetical protein